MKTDARETFRNHEKGNPPIRGYTRRIDSEADARPAEVMWRHRSGALYAGPPNASAWTALKQLPREWEQVHQQQHHEHHRQLSQQQKGTTSCS